MPALPHGSIVASLSPSIRISTTAAGQAAPPPSVASGAAQPPPCPAAMDASALQSVKARFTLDLHPSKLHDIRAGIREQLNAQLLRYNDDLDGVVVSYAHERALSAPPLIGTYFPYFRVAVEAQVLLFKPAAGSQLVGKVIKVGADYIGLLVLDVFNAAIGREAIRKEFALDEAAGAWSSRKHSEHSIRLGDSVRFHVQSLQDQAGLFSILGSLQESDTGEVAFVSAHETRSGGGKEKGAVAGSDKSAKKQKKEKRKREGEDKAEKSKKSKKDKQ